MGSSTTFPVALITNSAAMIPSTCERYLASTVESGSTTWGTYVARDCTGVTVPAVAQAAETGSTYTITSAATVVAWTTSTESDSSPTTTISSTSTTTSTANNACDGLSTITITVQSTPPISTFSTTIYVNGTSYSSDSSDGASTADPASTAVHRSSSATAPRAPISPPSTPTTPVTPGSPTPTVFNGSAETIKSGSISGLLVILALVSVFAQ
ncbi:hypothetical protein B0J12DRAFT_670061 [Macrophomina phaseolina]|nr:hypothetical protein B0J12DRAFT_670061 [Macrophomina phaseolina]